ncbi:MAG: NAD(P)H-dependent oxidoreductase subunit E [Patescibacteria group bacterium]|nr:NAD(P)H-dependent oxidoreductase subunit E [Patescibacteria group bacterium]
MLDLAFVDDTIVRFGRDRAATIPVLQAIQEHYRWLPPEALRRVCELSEITPAAITGVSTFYAQFRHSPMGEHAICICHGTACHVKGSGRLQEAFERYLGIPEGDDTDPQRRFTVEKVACLGCCTLAPVIQIDGITYGHLAGSQVGGVVEDFLRRLRDGNGKQTGRVVMPEGELGEIRVGLGSCCQAQGSAGVHAAIERTLAETGAPAAVKQVGCVGMCHQTPLVELVSTRGEHRLFAKVTPDDVPHIILSHFKPRGLLRRWGHRLGRWLDRLASDEAGVPEFDRAIDPRDPPVCAFLGPQRHVATEHCGNIDPADVDEYLRHHGFKALERARKLAPEEVIRQVTESGLRGRGGAGFSTGVKWQRVREAPGEVKYLVCNGDEGDPGAFMDRMILESFPYRVIEGMLIGAHAVGAKHAFFYIRAEYPLAVRRIRDALEVCRERGLLGDVGMTIKEGAGAFVCGEETGLIASIEGRRGMPRLRPPFPAQQGLWGRPTLVNNVETYAALSWILRHGPDAFAALGTKKSRGTKVFALAGKVLRGGLSEVPMGVTVRQIVDDIGGGVPGGRTFKAVQVGGPSGGCVPARLADTPVDFEALTAAGAIMGSGGLVVLDDADCMVDIARYFLQFTQEQSCGKCTFCRIGTRRMLELLERLCAGKGKATDLGELEQLAHLVQNNSLCGLGRTAPNPVLSTLRYFREEYEAHLEGHCPAGKCTALIEYQINHDCIGCTLCAQQCPVDAIAFTPYRTHEIDQAKCTRCDTCRQVCPADAVVIGDKGTSHKTGT